MDSLKSAGGAIFDKVFSGILWFSLGFILFIVVSVLIWYFGVYRKKFDIDVKILSERVGEVKKIIFDKATIIKDKKTGTKFFKLWSQKVELPVPPFAVLQITNKGDYLELGRKGEDEWYFLTPARIDYSKIIKKDGKTYLFSEQEHKPIDTDTSFWSVKRKGMNKSMFNPEGLFAKLIPYIPMLLSSALTMFCLYILMDKLPQILSELTKLSKEMNAGRTATIVSSGMIQLMLSKIK